MHSKATSSAGWPFHSRDRSEHNFSILGLWLDWMHNDDFGGRQHLGTGLATGAAGPNLIFAGLGYGPERSRSSGTLLRTLSSSSLTTPLGLVCLSPFAAASLAYRIILPQSSSLRSFLVVLSPSLSLAPHSCLCLRLYCSGNVLSVTLVVKYTSRSLFPRYAHCSCVSLPLLASSNRHLDGFQRLETPKQRLEHPEIRSRICAPSAAFLDIQLLNIRWFARQRRRQRGPIVRRVFCFWLSCIRFACHCIRLGLVLSYSRRCWKMCWLLATRSNNSSSQFLLTSLQTLFFRFRCRQLPFLYANSAGRN